MLQALALQPRSWLFFFVFISACAAGRASGCVAAERTLQRRFWEESSRPCRPAQFPRAAGARPVQTNDQKEKNVFLK
jgi:hypothetical protein